MRQGQLGMGAWVGWSRWDVRVGWGGEDRDEGKEGPEIGEKGKVKSLLVL